MDRHSNHGRSAVVDEVGAGGGGDVGGEGVGGANTFSDSMRPIVEKIVTFIV